MQFLSRFRPVLAFAAVLLLMASIGCSSLVKEDDQPTTSAELTSTQSSSELAIQTPAVPTDTAVPTAVPETSNSVPSPTTTREPTSIPPTEEVFPTETPTQVPKDLALMSADISLYPVPAIFEGDVVTVQIDPTIPRRMAPNDVDVTILLDGEELVSGNLNWRNLNGDASGLYQWIWDTAQSAGSHKLTAILDPDDKIQVGDEDQSNNLAEIDLFVRPADALTDMEAEAAWITTSNNCCSLHVVSGTAAHRDLDLLSDEVDRAFATASDALDEPLGDSYDVFLIDRVIGQGGYASNSMVISYLDRDYAGSGIFEVLVHEAVHLMDRQFAPDRISFLSEGLAVWATGGHYQQENINQKMAGLVEGSLYVPIEKVVDQIYSIQHEISYLEAASFISYLIETYGWDRVRPFYADTTSDDGSTLAEALGVNLQIHFDKSLSEIEEDWLAFLVNQPRDFTAVTNLRTTVRYYDLMREYQQQFDPSAYYLSAWLPPPLEAKEQGITADLTRHPETSTNIALEAILLSAKEALSLKEYSLANAYLDTVERVLENDGRFFDPLADSYLNIVRTAMSSGYEVQQIDLFGDRAVVLATQPDSLDLSELTLELVDSSTWVLMR